MIEYIRKINTIERWKIANDYLSQNNYTLWQMQYDTKSPEGFHARFYVTGKPDIEIITFNEEVYKAILKYPN